MSGSRRAPATLAHDWPKLLGREARAEVQERLDRGCNLNHGGPAQLACRRTKSALYVMLQCLTCGAALGAAFRRDDHPDWASYPAFDDDIRPTWEAADRERRSTEWEQGRAERQANYAAFLLTHEWRRLRAKVLKRAGYLCEACVDQEATEVHHRTYAMGWAPPAWCLAAVCGDCHVRFTDPDDDWGPRTLLGRTYNPDSGDAS